MKAFTRETTGVEVVEELSDRVKGRTFIITGASESGLGAETAVALAHGHPEHLILLARSQARVNSVISQIKEISPNTKVDFVPVSLDDFDSVRSAAATINSSIEKLHGLINNAGVMAPDNYAANKNGIEMQFATNHLGHFLLTKLLFPKIAAAAPGSRIINLTSLGHKISPVRFDDYNFSGGKTYNPWEGYGQSKSANVLFSHSLGNKLQSRGIQSFSVHPGAIFNTNLARDISDVHAALAAIDPVAIKNTGRHFPLAADTPKPIDTGITTTLVAALDTRIEAQSGSYMADAKIDTAYEYATDDANAERLWELSEQLVGEKFDV
ncbi:short-chain dehydrogenase [Exophiala viscosa]|uniref:Short-chain dehydrogenase n=1 Tax=Exophiala viscosa TaxID=2486360 RepID=A0AAN6IGL3_9EURO|nr:short-chain dehydrogenase [Exophiala viscosa]KAI1629665.1 short-chain dehydrogenase [Exophiala viscosa]